MTIRNPLGVNLLIGALLDRLGSEGLIDWEKACVDSQSYRAVFGGP